MPGYRYQGDPGWDPAAVDPIADPDALRLCTRRGCDRTHRARGLCATCYREWLRAGRPDLASFAAR